MNGTAQETNTLRTRETLSSGENGLIAKTAHSWTEWQYKIAHSLLTHGLDAGASLQNTLSLTGESLRCLHGCIVLFEADATLRHAYLLGSDGEAEAARDLWNRLIAQGLVAYTRYGGRTINIRNISVDPRWGQSPANRLIPETGSALAVPFQTEDQCVGVLAFLNENIDYYDSRAVEFLEGAVHLLSAHLNNAAQMDAAHTREAGYRRVAERVQMERSERMRTEQLRHDLTAMTYHDMRGPLQNIQTSLAGLQRAIERENPKLIAEFMTVAGGSARQISRMVKGLLDIERLEGGNSILNRSQTNVAAMVNEAVALLKTVAMDAEQTLTADLSDGLPTLAIDSDMILRVVSNLVENAVKHTPSGGSITVRADADRGAVYISVIDNGPGIPPEYRDEIFDKFIRIKYQDAPSGVGLGLAFCRMAVEAHGGRIWVHSEVGEGAAFTFTLPMENEPPPTATLSHPVYEETMGD